MADVREGRPTTPLCRLAAVAAADSLRAQHTSAARDCRRAAPRFYELEKLGGMSATTIWEVQTPVTDVPSGGDPPDGLLPMTPAPGAVRFFRFVPPPDSSVDPDRDAIVAKVTERLPSFFEAIDPEREFGMHRTDTIDLTYIASGAVDLILETGKTILREGDSMVQLGTWHAWSNPYEAPCVMIQAMVRRAEET